MSRLKFEIQYIGASVHAITAVMGEMIYLVTGKKKALIIDTGLGLGRLLPVIREITDLPLVVVNTHGHPDHGGGNAEFDEVFIHQKDSEIYQSMCSRSFRLRDIEAQLGHGLPEEHRKTLLPLKEIVIHLHDFQVFDLGDRQLTVIPVPGHTPGSICLYDPSCGYLFTGDTISLTDTWLYLDHCESLETYVESLENLLNGNEYTLLFPGHSPTPVSPDVLNLKLHCAREILFGGKIGTVTRTFAGSGLKHTSAGVSIIYNPDNLKKKTKHL